MNQFTMTDRNTAKSTAYTLQTKTVAFVMLWLWSADGQAFAKNPPPSEQLTFTNLNRWESINFPSVRIPFEDGKVRSNLWISVWIHPTGTGLDVSVTGWTGSLGSSPPSIDGGKLILRLHRLTGEIIESKVLNSGSALGFSRGGYVDWGFYYSFPRATNPMEEAWIELKIAKQRFWLEVPYGFTQTPSNFSTRPVFNGPPKFVPAMKDRAPEDLILAWREVRYNLGAIQNGWHLSLIALNTFEPETEIELYRDDVRAGASMFRWDLRGPPQASLSILDSDGRVFKAKCMGVRISDDGMRRIDTFKCLRWPQSDERCWGMLTVEVDDKSYNVVLPSSLYKFGHNAAEPYDNARIREWR